MLEVSHSWGLLQEGQAIYQHYRESLTITNYLFYKFLTSCFLLHKYYQYTVCDGSGTNCHVTHQYQSVSHSQKRLQSEMQFDTHKMPTMDYLLRNVFLSHPFFAYILFS